MIISQWLLLSWSTEPSFSMLASGKCVLRSLPFVLCRSGSGSKCLSTQLAVKRVHEDFACSSVNLKASPSLDVLYSTKNCHFDFKAHLCTHQNQKSILPKLISVSSDFDDFDSSPSLLAVRSSVAFNHQIPAESFRLSADVSCLCKNPLLQNDSLRHRNANVWMAGDSLTGPSAFEAMKFPEGKPNFTQLQHIVTRLSANLPHFFSRQQDYSFYRQDLIFENRIQGFASQGLQNYRQNMATIRILAHLRYSFIQLKLLNVSPLLDSGTVRVRWRVCTLGFFRSLAFFFKKGFWNKDLVAENADWFDGYSIFHVDGNGLIYKHEIDRLESDENKSAVKTNKQLIAEKLAGAKA